MRHQSILVFCWPESRESTRSELTQQLLRTFGHRRKLVAEASDPRPVRARARALVQAVVAAGGVIAPSMNPPSATNSSPVENAASCEATNRT